MSQPATIGYADLKTTKQYLNIPDSNTVSDEKIASHMRDADSFVNVQVGVHRDTPLKNPDRQLISLASGLSASLYNYWQTPAKNQTLDGIKQWEKRIGDHVRAVYGQEDITGHTGGTFTTTSGITGTESSSGSTV
ncbi:hypothetical protein LCGC14_0870670 [marine sediment metagenome]|uniref:Uncharacterized protein n=1 Tax=marine sediment metagenome TaxID=412755 RepID=A0A0F9P4V6_9ZZZZ